MTCILTIGNFDGLHLGHRQLMATTIELAHHWGTRAVAMTFTPHPKQFFHPTTHFFIHPEPVKERILESLGLDEIIYLPFANIYQLTPIQFFEDILLPLEPLAIVLGENFTFGCGKTGDIEVLRRLCAMHEIALYSLSMKPWRNEPVSSSRIRNAIQTGHVEEATAMLTTPYTLYGHVAHGANRGHSLGFATANIHTPEQVMPKIGVYASHVEIDEDGKNLKAMTAVTQTPTFGGVQTVVETHIFDFNRDLYGHPISVSFDAFLRDEMAFQSIDELVHQIKMDAKRAKSFDLKTVSS